MGHEHFNRVCLVAVAASMLSACEGLLSEEAPPQSDRGGIGMMLPAPGVEDAPAPGPLDIRRSLAVTEKSILARFGGRRVFSKLVADNAGAGFTPEQLFRQLWDTQNPAPGQPDLPGMPHCSDQGNTLNGFPYVCRPSEGGQARPDSVINPSP